MGPVGAVLSTTVGVSGVAASEPRHPAARHDRSGLKGESKTGTEPRTAAAPRIATAARLRRAALRAAPAQGPHRVRRAERWSTRATTTARSWSSAATPTAWSPGFRLNYPETVRPPLEIFGLSPGAKVAVGMYMMVLQNSVKFFGDTVFNIFPDADTLADITVQMADAVPGLRHHAARRDDLVLELRLGPASRRHAHPRARSTSCASAAPISRSTARCSPSSRSIRAPREYVPVLAADARGEHLVFPSLASGNAAYQMLKVLGSASRSARSSSASTSRSPRCRTTPPTEDIVNMTAYVVLAAQQQG